MTLVVRTAAIARFDHRRRVASLSMNQSRYWVVEAITEVLGDPASIPLGLDRDGRFVHQRLDHDHLARATGLGLRPGAGVHRALRVHGPAADVEVVPVGVVRVHHVPVV
jgi:hypothetical protein